MENVWKVMLSCGASAILLFFGNWSWPLIALVVMIVLDYVSGMWAAGLEGKLNSKVGYKGIPRKAAILVVVAAGHLADLALGNSNFFRDATVFFYLANELLSVIENAGRLGIPVPDTIRQAVEVLKKKGDAK